MKRKFALLALMLAALLCIGMLAGCSSDENTDDTSSESTEEVSSTESAEEEEDVIGIVTFAESTNFTLATYTSESEIDDYASVDVDELTEEGNIEYIYVGSDTEYYVVSSGSLEAAEAEELNADDIVAVTTSDDGVQQVIILKNLEKEINAEIAEVTAIPDTDELSLMIYDLTDDAADYRITDAAAIEFSNYEATEKSKDCLVSSDTVIFVCEDGVTTEADISEIAIGDMLAIYTDDDEVETIVIYHSGSAE